MIPGFDASLAGAAAKPLEASRSDHLTLVMTGLVVDCGQVGSWGSIP